MTRAASQLFPLAYAVHGGSPSVDLSFAVEADGACLVDVLTGYTLGQVSPVRLGTFSCRLPALTLEALTRWAETAVAGNQDPQPPGTPSRFLSRAGETPQPVGGEPPAQLDGLLADAAKAALGSPVSAIEVKAAAEPDKLDLRLVITSIGTKPCPIVLFEKDGSGYWPRLRRDDAGTPEGGVFLPYEEIQALVNQGAIEEGVVQLSPGQSLSLPLPATGENVPATGSFMFWRAGKGPERRLLAGSWLLNA